MNKDQRLKIEYSKVTNRRKVSGAHSHLYYELYYLVSGETAYFVGDEIFHLYPHDFIMVPKNIIHGTDSEECLHNERILVTFSEDILDDSIKPFVDMLCCCKLIHIPDNKLYIFEEILQKVQSEKDMSYPLVRLYVLELLALLCRHKTEKVRSVVADRIIDDISEYIRENYAEDLSLHALGRKFGMSESALSRKFKGTVGLGVNEYITQVRVFNAERILKRKNITVTRAAELCGFSDSNYFSTVFKRIKGITPYKYHKNECRFSVDNTLSK